MMFNDELPVTITQRPSDDYTEQYLTELKNELEDQKELLTIMREAITTCDYADVAYQQGLLVQQQHTSYAVEREIIDVRYRLKLDD